MLAGVDPESRLVSANTQPRDMGSSMDANIHRRIVLAACLLTMWPMNALAEDWVVADRSGTVFVLTGAEWVDLGRGDIVPGGSVIRTVGRGNVLLKLDGNRLALGTNTTAEIVQAANDHTGWSVRQHSGALRIELASGTASVTTPFVVAVSNGGVLISELGDRFARIAAAGGEVVVTSSLDGSKLTVLPGQVLTSAIGPRAAGAETGAVATPSALSAASGSTVTSPAPGATPVPLDNGSTGVTDGASSSEAAGTDGAANTPGGSGNAGGNGNGGANGAGQSGGNGSSASGGAAGGTASNGQSSSPGNSGGDKGSGNGSPKAP